MIAPSSPAIRFALAHHSAAAVAGAITIATLLASSLPCAIAEDAEPKPEGTPTFSEHVAPILHQNCVSCHRPGEAAPFALIDYADAKRRARTIARVVGDRYMPPWHPVPGHGEFAGERRLTDEQIATLKAWAEGGAPEGDPALTPEPPEFPEGWQLGEPDLVLEMEEAFEIPAEGRDIYRYFAIPVGLPEDRWVRAVEVRPSARSVVHHTLFFLDDSGKAVELQAEDKDEPGFNGRGFRRNQSLGGWAVGGLPLELDEGYAMPMPKGTDFVLQTHFHPSGKVEHEKTRIGIYFADQAPERKLLEFQVPPAFGASTGLLIQAGDDRYVLEDHMTVPEDLELITVWGHAHQICTSMEATATLPDGTTLPLFKIDDWNFNWQGQYAYVEPVALPKGTRIETRIEYDNSDSNPNNPYSPPRLVRWGEQSFDEMGSVIFQCVAADKRREVALNVGLKLQSAQSARRFADNRRVLLRVYAVLRLDANQDDRVTLGETPAEHHRAFHQLDQNGDEVVDLDEIIEFGGFLDRTLRR